MKIQLEIFTLCLKKILKWYLIMIAIAIMYIISIQFARKIGYNDLIIILGNFDLNHLDFFGILLMIYHCSFTIYFSYLFYTYELDKCIYSILLRLNSKRWIKSKLFIQLLGILFLRLFYYLVILLIMQFDVKKHITIIITSMSIHLLLSILVVFFFNHIKKNLKIIFLIVIICCIEAIFNNYILFPNVIVSVILTIYEVFKFNFKKNLYHITLPNA